MSTNPILTRRISTIYVAYAPEFAVHAYGGCQDEALNNLSDELREHKRTADPTGEERK